MLAHPTESQMYSFSIQWHIKTEKIIEIETWGCPPKPGPQKHADHRPLDYE